MARMPKWVKCATCKRRATLGLPSNLSAQFVRNANINEKTRKLFEQVFGKKKAAKIRSTGDVDACFRDVARRYPHLMPGYDRQAVRKHGKKYDPRSEADMRELGHPGDISHDPFPHDNITETRDMHPERRVM